MVEPVRTLWASETMAHWLELWVVWSLMVMHTLMNIGNKFYIMILPFRDLSPKLLPIQLKMTRGKLLNRWANWLMPEAINLNITMLFSSLSFMTKEEMQRFVSYRFFRMGKFKRTTFRKEGSIRKREKPSFTLMQTAKRWPRNRVVMVIEMHLSLRLILLRGSLFSTIEKGRKLMRIHICHLWGTVREMILPSIEPLMTGQALEALVFRSVKMVTIGNH